MNVSQARALLQVPVGSGQADIERAFRRQAQQTHPDRGGDPTHFQAIVHARNVLRRSRTRPPAPVVIVPDQRWWHHLTRLWPDRNQPNTRRVI